MIAPAEARVNPPTAEMVPPAKTRPVTEVPPVIETAPAELIAPIEAKLFPVLLKVIELLPVTENPVPPVTAMDEPVT